MGMYTELFVEGRLKDKAPQDVVRIINGLFNHGEIDADLTAPLPDHTFFRCGRWQQITVCNSFYHVPVSISVFDAETRSFVSRADLKNYNDEIEHFLNWIEPYCDDLRGWHWYEEADYPTIFIKKEFNDVP